METAEVILSSEQFTQLITSLQDNQTIILNIAENLGHAAQYVTLISIGVFVWLVIKILYSLFAHVFFGGV